MKNWMKKSYLLPGLSLVGGLLLVLLRLWTFAGQEDSTLLAEHPAVQIVMVLLIALMAGATLRLLGKKMEHRKYYDWFPASKIGAVGCFAGAAGVFCTSLMGLMERPGFLPMLCHLLGVFAALSLGFIGVCRMNRRRPNFLFHAGICIYLMLFLICRYQHWSIQTQPERYAFQLLALTCLMLSMCHRIGFDLNQPQPRRYLFFTSMSVFFCLPCLVDTTYQLFYLGLGVWAATNLCTMPNE